MLLSFYICIYRYSYISINYERVLSFFISSKLYFKNSTNSRTSKLTLSSDLENNLSKKERTRYKYWALNKYSFHISRLCTNQCFIIVVVIIRKFKTINSCEDLETILMKYQYIFINKPT